MILMKRLIGDDSADGRSRMDNFLKSMKENLDPANSEHKDSSW